MSTKSRARPRGLWKGRGRPQHVPALDSDDNPRPTKRQRYQHSEDTDSDDEDSECYYVLEYLPEPSGSVSCEMDTEASAAETDTKVEDWEDLKELFGRAAEQYESGCTLLRSESAS